MNSRCSAPSLFQKSSYARRSASVNANASAASSALLVSGLSSSSCGICVVFSFNSVRNFSHRTAGQEQERDRRPNCEMLPGDRQPLC